jgi:hypothetical protein
LRAITDQEGDAYRRWSSKGKAKQPAEGSDELCGALFCPGALSPHEHLLLMFQMGGSKGTHRAASLLATKGLGGDTPHPAQG